MIRTRYAEWRGATGVAMDRQAAPASVRFMCSLGASQNFDLTFPNRKVSLCS